jgi:hypothetical protein
VHSLISASVDVDRTHTLIARLHVQRVELLVKLHGCASVSFFLRMLDLELLLQFIVSRL